MNNLIEAILANEAMGDTGAVQRVEARYLPRPRIIAPPFDFAAPYGMLPRDFLERIVYASEIEAGMINRDVCLTGAVFKGDEGGWVWKDMRAGGDIHAVELTIPNIIFSKDHIIASRISKGDDELHSRAYQAKFIFDSALEQRCLYHLGEINKDNSISVHWQAGFDIPQIQKFHSLLRDVRFCLLGAAYSKFSAGAFVGIISNKGEYFVRENITTETINL